MNSLIYPAFLAAAAAVYYLCPKKLQNLLLLLVSLGFYFSFSTGAGVWLLLSVGAYYGLGRLAAKENRKKLALGLALLLGVGGLVAVKYLRFVFSLFGAVPPIAIAEPLGISFYTFQSLSYIIDVYRGRQQPIKCPIICALYITFFPSLLSGPISRAEDMLPQYESPRSYSSLNVRAGASKFLMGLFKKAVVADGVAILVDGIWADFGTFTGEALLIAAVGFAVQLYFDFSGYSDMAIGSARVLGIALPENFKTPYLAASYREFWSRWHISLTSWFRDYVYISLGGNRKGEMRKMLNIMIIFALSGLWHGAALTYLVWGVIQGVLRILDELVFPRSRAVPKNRLAHLLRIALVLALWSLSLVFFRAPDLSNALQYLVRMFKAFSLSPAFKGEIFSIVGGTVGGSAEFIKGFCASMVASALGVTAIEYITCKGEGDNTSYPLLRLCPAVRFAVILLMLLLLMLFGAFGSSNFIYFNF